MLRRDRNTVSFPARPDRSPRAHRTAVLLLTAALFGPTGLPAQLPAISHGTPDTGVTAPVAGSTKFSPPKPG